MAELHVVELGKKPDERVVKLLEEMLVRAREGETVAIVAMELSATGETSRHGSGMLSFSDYIAAIELWKHDIIHQRMMVEAGKK